jgi:uncharacterized protein (DUF302 family)
MTAEGLKVSRSRHGPRETLGRLEVAVARYGLTVVARIDHGAAAEKVGLELRPTVVVIFGNPRGGTPLMQAVPTVAIDLPLKALVWQDEAGTTWLGYNDPAWILRRHGGIDDGSIDPMIEALAAIANEATTA